MGTKNYSMNDREDEGEATGGAWMMPTVPNSNVGPKWERKHLLFMVH